METRGKALLDWLDTQGRENVEELNAILKNMLPHGMNFMVD